MAGIGPKTAVDLLKDVNYVEDIYTKLETGSLRGVSDVVKEKLLSGKKNALLSKDLATIRKNVPIEFEEKQARVKTLETTGAIDFLETMQFHTLLKRLLQLEEEEPKKIETKKDSGEQQALF